MRKKLENKEICKNCGFCCKKCGCDYSVKDFEDLSYKALCQILEEGNISVVSFLQFRKTLNNKILVVPFLYLRARNNNRPIIDLLSFKTTCSQLDVDGCRYDFDHRPSGGKNLVPKENLNCYPFENHETIIEGWKNHQKSLARIVKRMTGKGVETKLREDVENLFYDINMENFEGVTDVELEEILKIIPILTEVYPSEAKNAYGKYLRMKKDTPKLMVLNKRGD